jgi:hypothetical protein
MLVVEYCLFVYSFISVCFQRLDDKDVPVVRQRLLGIDEWKNCFLEHIVPIGTRKVSELRKPVASGLYVDGNVSEKKFWNNVHFCSSPQNAPIYGSDYEGTFFDNSCPFPEWNLDQLDTMLNKAGRLPGLNSPFLYFGQPHSVFGVHTEDMELFSINYVRIYKLFFILKFYLILFNFI